MVVIQIVDPLAAVMERLHKKNVMMATPTMPMDHERSPGTCGDGITRTDWLKGRRVLKLDDADDDEEMNAACVSCPIVEMASKTPEE